MTDKQVQHETTEEKYETDEQTLNTDYLFVTGGVMSGLGKGITAASIGRLLKNAEMSVTAIKIDPYLNVDAGTMNPLEHGEVYVLDDGSEVDLDLGNYERFLGCEMSAENNITTGKVYQTVINKERSGDYYLGDTIQIIPHITNEIKRRLKEVPDENHDICIVELGGTIGDIEGQPFTEAVRQFTESYPRNAALCHVTLVPYSPNDEQKTKPTQHSVKELRSIGLDPDIIVGRCTDELNEKTKEKIALFCDVPQTAVFSNPDVEDIYAVPKKLKQQNIRECVLELLSLSPEKPKTKWGSKWSKIVNSPQENNTEINIALIGKYDLEDAYLSIYESLKHAEFNSPTTISTDFIHSEKFESKEGDDTPQPDENKIKKELSLYDGVIIPGGFGKRGTTGKIGVINYCRENNIPFLGICFGMQLAVVEFARSKADLQKAHSAELNGDTNHPVISILPDQHDVENMGGTMRLGGQHSKVKQETLTQELYGNEYTERHRHRYEVNPEYIDILEDNGLVFSSYKNNRMETIELRNNDHPFYYGTQFHPEFNSSPDDPSPVFMELVHSCRDSI